MNHPFGTPRRAPVDRRALRESAERILTAHRMPGLTATLVDTHDQNPLLYVEEDERHYSITIDDLARDIERRHTAEADQGLSNAIIGWLQNRPVTDQQARSGGIAALDWADDDETIVAWRVFVRRDGLVLPWTPTAITSRNDIHRTQSAAFGRSANLTGAMQIADDVALWTATDLPMLSTALLVNPETMLTTMARGGLAARDMHVIIVPDRPVACASADAARRLAGETAEAHVTVPWRQVADFGWVT